MRGAAATGGASGRSRYVVVLAVAASHIALIVVLVVVSRGRTSGPSADSIPTQVVFLPAPKVDRTPPPPPQTSKVPKRPPDQTPPVPQNAPPPELSEPLQDETSSQAIHPNIDWDAEGRRSVGVIVKREVAKGGMTKNAEEHDSPSKHPWWPRSIHHAGDEDGDRATGETIEWISDRCYIAEKRPPAGTPDFLARLPTTRFGCKDPSAGKARGDLFDKLPAYRKLHPDE